MKSTQVKNALLDALNEGSVEFIETHISWVFLRKNTVLKVKKPVTFAFLDFSSLSKREWACNEEVRLNQRLAPQVYLGVSPIVQTPSGAIRIGCGDEERWEPECHVVALDETVLEWCVVMRRLSDSDCLKTKIATGTLTWEQLAGLVQRLVAFHADTQIRQPVSCAKADEITRNVEENFEEAHDLLLPFVSEEEQQELEGYQLDFLKTNAEQFLARQQSGRIVEGHGDLRLEHVYVQQRGLPIAIDCIEFNERYRICDVCADIAFLSMDLAWHGRRDLAERFLAEYALQSGDYDLYFFADFYQSYRAYVRAKVSVLSLAAALPQSERSPGLADSARRYIELARPVARPTNPPPTLYAVGGLIASGKSLVSATISEHLAVPIVSTDRTRKELLNLSPLESAQSGNYQGACKTEFSQTVYEEVLRRAACVLASGRSVIVDASFQKRQHRLEARSLARQGRGRFFLVECRVPPSVAIERLKCREATRCESDARLPLYEEFSRRYEPVTELKEREHCVLDTAGAIDETKRQALSVVEGFRKAEHPSTNEGSAA